MISMNLVHLDGTTLDAWIANVDVPISIHVNSTINDITPIQLAMTLPGPRGLQGEVGPQGEMGPPGPQGVKVI